MHMHTGTYVGVYVWELQRNRRQTREVKGKRVGSSKRERETV